MNRVITQSIHTEKAIFLSLCFVCAALFALYIYFVSASVAHVVLRTEINQDITHIASEISELEGKYIAAQHKVSADIATLSGYVQASHKVFIDRTPASLVLSTEANR